jgi:hypothetical protein
VHSPLLHRLLAQSRMQELRAAAARDRIVRDARATTRQIPAESAVTLRFAFPDDERSLARLASLDSAELPRQPVLVAEVDGELRAGMSLADGAVVADPFHRTAALVELLRARAEQLSAGNGPSRSLRKRSRAWVGFPIWSRTEG